MILAKLVAVSLSDGAVFPHPFIPHMAVPLLEKTHIIGLFLPYPKDFFHRCLECHKLGGQDRKLLFQIKLHDLVRQFIRRHSRAVIA